MDQIAELERPAWHGRAACRDHDVALFFPTSGRTAAGRRQVERARSICDQCPVRAECARAGQRQRYGVWAGEVRGVRW